MERKRIVMLFAAAWISAALLTWFLYAHTVAPQAERRTSIVAAAHDLGARHLGTAGVCRLMGAGA